jgi:sugar phosphate isomerase/epimerase
LAQAFAKAARLGFDAVEIFASSPEAVLEDTLRPLLERHRLTLAALGTGAGWVVHKLTLTHPDAAHRARAVAFVRSLIAAGAGFGAPVIVGSMQGRWGDGLSREVALEYLRHALNELGEHARGKGVPLLFEPLNRYETNLVNTLADGVYLLRSLQTKNVKLLADLFHMNIEEADVAGALREAGADVGHVHLADSNRRPAGNGHTDFGGVAAALRQIDYQGYLSAECLAYPDPDAAAETTINAFRRFFS